MTATPGTPTPPERVTSHRYRHDHLAKHGDPVRGMSELPKKIVPDMLLVNGLFGRLLPLDKKKGIEAADFPTEALDKLASAMTTDSGLDVARDSGIPALYTYFGQFVTHDLTFDPQSSFQKQNDRHARFDFRTPALDLDSLYGRGPIDQPYMYTPPPQLNFRADWFVLGEPLSSGYFGAVDLPRNNREPARALIADPRNDENIIIAQLHALFLRFHNRIADDNSDWCFEQVQQSVRLHYQDIVINDFLPRIVDKKVLDTLKKGKKYRRENIKLFQWKTSSPKFENIEGLHQYPFIPIEFSVAAFRFGHSMIRPGYQVNPQVFKAIFPLPDSPPDSQEFPSGLTGFRQINRTLGIDWRGFIDMEPLPNSDPGPGVQFAFKINTALSKPLALLPRTVASPPIRSLAERNLRRGRDLGLPSGQTVANYMQQNGLIAKDDILDDAEILIGSPEKNGKRKKILGVDPHFKKNCPLWTYILAEAERHQETVGLPFPTPKLGPVGGRIVAEVLLELLFEDGKSVLYEKNWAPSAFATYAKPKDHYTLADLVSYTTESRTTGPGVSAAKTPKKP